MRYLLRNNPSIYCHSNEHKVNIYINGTRIVGCEHSNKEDGPSLALLLGLLIPFAVLLSIVLCWSCGVFDKVKKCYSKIDSVENTAQDDAFVERCLGEHLQNFRAGILTEQVQSAIGLARTKGGPVSNSLFESYFRRRCQYDDGTVDKTWLEGICFEIRNIQPI